VRYQTVEIGAHDVHLCTLRDKQQFSDDGGASESLGISSATWSMFGVLWESANVLAHHMLDFELSGKRILEVGCGIGLASHLLNLQENDISATDHHPEAAGMMRHNSELNGTSEIPFERLQWAEHDSGLGQFDVIIASDVLYDRRHLAELAEFIDAHARPQCEVVIVDPGRGESGRFSKYMTALGYAITRTTPLETVYLEKPFKGHVLHYFRAS